VNLVMFASDPCSQCGYQTQWMQTAGYRVNKRSLRQTSPSLIVHANPRGGCPECGFHHRSDHAPWRWRLKPEDQVRVDDYRERRFG
jgi:Zn ribbon nucleic-acid-binding protein